MIYNTGDVLIIFHESDDLAYRKRQFNTISQKHQVEGYVRDAKTGTFSEVVLADESEESLLQIDGLIIRGSE